MLACRCEGLCWHTGVRDAELVRGKNTKRQLRKTVLCVNMLCVQRAYRDRAWLRKGHSRETDSCMNRFMDKYPRGPGKSRTYQFADNSILDERCFHQTLKDPEEVLLL